MREMSRIWDNVDSVVSVVGTVRSVVGSSVVIRGCFWLMN